MSDPKTCPFEGVLEVDFNSEPFLTRFRTLINSVGGEAAALEIKDKHVLMLIPSNQNLFEAPTIFKPALQIDDIQDFIKEVALILELVDILNHVLEGR